ncbi:MAG: hypothetical protein QOJ95_5483 [Mycobacterium sp.]|jgi:hypothetical protein|nr:hypothetical protein [Mycobacterium sp.]
MGAVKQPNRRDGVVNDRWSRVREGLAAAALGAFVVTGVATSGLPAAVAAPPATDDHGFVDSTARCAAPSKAVAFGYTSNSRVAICKDDASGQYQYRGVRLSDGARLILDAKSTDRGFVAENDGITYTVTSAALVIGSGSQQIRSEPMLDFHGSAPGSSSTASSSASSSSAPATTSGPTQPSAIPEPVTPSTPLPPPLPAEVGHG